MLNRVTIRVNNLTEINMTVFVNAFCDTFVVAQLMSILGIFAAHITTLKYRQRS